MHYYILGILAYFDITYMLYRRRFLKIPVWCRAVSEIAPADILCLFSSVSLPRYADYLLISSRGWLIIWFPILWYIISGGSKALKISPSSVLLRIKVLNRQYQFNHIFLCLHLLVPLSVCSSIRMSPCLLLWLLICLFVCPSIRLHKTSVGLHISFVTVDLCSRTIVWGWYLPIW